MIEVKSDNAFYIKGIIDVNNVVHLLKQSCEIIDQKADLQTDIIFDFSQLEQSSSVGLSFLTNLLRHAHERHQNIQFLHLPARLWAAAKISDLDKIFPCAPVT